MARLWQCGFELQSSTAGVELSALSGTLSVQNAVARTGYALRTNPSASTAFARFHVFAANQAIDGYQRVYLRIATLPSADTVIYRFADATNTPTAQVRLTTAGKLQLLKADALQLGSDSATLNTGQWYRIDLRCNATSSPGTIDARIDGASFASGDNSAQGSWARVLVGAITSTTADLYFDDWALNDASGSAQTSWPPDGKIIHLVPDGDGDSHQWADTAGSAGTANNYTLVDETPPNDVTDFVQSTTLNDVDSYALTDSGIGAGDTVNCVVVGVRARNNTSSSVSEVTVQIKKASGGTVSQGAGFIPNATSWLTNATVEPRVYPLTLYADPDGSAWTQATLDTAQAGIKLTADSNRFVQVTALWVGVDYTPSTVTPVSLAESASAADDLAVAASAEAAEADSASDGLMVSATASSADAAAADDALAVAVAKAIDDTGSAVDVALADAAVPLAESGASAEGLAASAAVPLADVGSGVDTSAVAASVPLAEAADAADVLSVATTKALAEAGAGADTAAVAVSAAPAESGAGADVSSASAAVPLAESASAADALAAVVGSTPQLAESGNAAEAIAATAAVPPAEAASAADGVGVTVTLPFTDAGSGADTATFGAALPLAESGSAADGLSVSVAAPLADAATGAGAPSASAAAPLGDTGSAGDAVLAARLVDLAESGSAGDVLALLAAAALTEAAAALDALGVAASSGLAESGSAGDGLSVAVQLPFTVGRLSASSSAASVLSASSATSSRLSASSAGPGSLTPGVE